MNSLLFLNLPNGVSNALIIIGTLLLLLLLSKTIFGWRHISSTKSGLITKKWSLKGNLEKGRFIATKGEAGIQAKILSPGLHFWYWWWMYSVEEIDPIVIETGKIGIVRAENGAALPSGTIISRTTVECNNYQDGEAFLNNGGIMGIQADFLRNGKYRINTKLFTIYEQNAIVIEKGNIGIVTTYDGEPLQAGEIAAREGVIQHSSFQNADEFLTKGGKRGLQEEVLRPSTYFINSMFAKVEQVPQTLVPIGTVGVITKYIGDAPVDVSGTEFTHGIIVSNGQKGVQKIPLSPNLYPLNTKICAIEIVPTTNIVLNWATAKNESHQLDSHLNTITARTKDGFAINLDVSQIINIAHDEAPKVIARFGTLKNLISQVLEPTIGNYFRNAVQNAMALQFITEREQRQNDAKEYMVKILAQYNVVGVDTLIGDIVPPDALLEPIRQKHIADQQKLMFIQQQQAEESRKDLENAKAEANIQGDVIRSARSIVISKNNADSIIEAQKGASKALELKSEAEAAAEKNVGFAKAEVTERQGQAVASAYEAQVKAMGQSGFTSLMVAEKLSSGNLQLVPQIMGGNSSDSMIGLLALKALGVELEQPKKVDNVK